MKNSPIRYDHHQSYTRRTQRLVRVLSLSLGILSLVSVAQGYEDGKVDVWIGTGKVGIYHLTLDTSDGKMSQPKLVSPTEGAGFLAIHPNGKVLYSTDRKGGSVSAFTIGREDQHSQMITPLERMKSKVLARMGDGHPSVKQITQQIEDLRARREQDFKDGKLDDLGARLDFINSLETGDGGAACVAVDKTGSALFSAQYGGGSTSSYTLDQDGNLAERIEVIEHGDGSNVDSQRQKTAHPHWVGTSPDNRFLLVPDLGLDRVVVYELDAEKAKLTPHARIPVPPGAGPRHMKFHTSGKYVYVLNELALTVSVFEYDAKDAGFKEIQVIETLTEEEKAGQRNSAAEVRVHPTGKFIYTSNRGHDSISVFSVDQATGKLTFVEYEHVRGAWPRNFNLDPSGKWLIAAGQNSNTLSLFKVDEESGRLSYVQQTVNVPAPICVVFAQ